MNTEMQFQEFPKMGRWSRDVIVTEKIDGTNAQILIAELEAQLALAQTVHLAPARAGRVYVSGPMTGLPELNFPAFHAAAKRLRDQGAIPVNPADHGLVEGAQWADYLRYDLAMVATCERLLLLPGWSRSKGARLELHNARELGMPVDFAEGAETSTEQPTHWYLQDTRSTVGNDVLWHRQGGKGYTTDLREAHRYSMEDALRAELARDTDKAWPAAYIDGKARPAVDFQYLNREEALAAEEATHAA